MEPTLEVFIKTEPDESISPNDVIGTDGDDDVHREMEISIDETSIKCEEDLIDEQHENSARGTIQHESALDLNLKSEFDDPLKMDIVDDVIDHGEAVQVSGLNRAQSIISGNINKSGEESNFLCQFCPLKFPTNNRLNSHVNLVHMGGFRIVSKPTNSGPQIRCEWCPQMFQSVSLLNGHKETNHPEHYKPPTFKVGLEQCVKVYPPQASSKSTPTSTGVTSKAIFLPPTLHKIPKKKFQPTPTDSKVFYLKATSAILSLETGSPETITYKVIVKQEPPMQCCSICRQKFKSFDQLKEHFRATHRTKTLKKYFPCKECIDVKKVFETNLMLQNHIKEVHRRPIKCKKCSDTLLGEEDFKRHMEDEHVTIYQCKFCKKIFLREFFLKVHVKRQHQNPTAQENEGLICHICKVQLDNNAGLANHFEQVHKDHHTDECEICSNEDKSEESEMRRKSKCSICKSIFNSGIELIRHAKTCRNENADRFPCRHCKMSFASLPKLRRHEKASNHSNSDVAETFDDDINDDPKSRKKVLKCQYCELSFTTAEELRIHATKTHQNSRDYRCDVCNSTFRFSWDLKRHKKHIHNAEMPTKTSKSDTTDVTAATLKPSDDNSTLLFVCGECHVTFPTSEELERHANEEHQIDLKEKTSKDEKDHEAAAVEDRPYVCELCGNKYASKCVLRVHILGVHEVERPFKCDKCEWSFKTPRRLKEHKQTTHEKIATIECQECDDKFINVRKLKMHVRIVHEKKTVFECRECHKAFTQKSYLKSHTDAIHKKMNRFRCDLCSKLFTTKQMLEYHLVSPNVHKITNKVMFQLDHTGQEEVDVSSG